MTPYLLRRLVFPLLIVEVIIATILYFAGAFNVLDLSQNIFSEILGIVVTVWFVDKVLTEHEANRWKNVKFKASWRVEVFINESLDCLLGLLNLRDKVQMGTINPEGGMVWDF